MKPSLKKKFRIKQFKKALNEKNFFGIYNATSLNMIRRLQLKVLFSSLGFDIKILNNKLLEKSLTQDFNKYQHFKPVIQGFSFLVIPKDNTKKVSLEDLKKLFLILKGEKNISFLGAIFNENLVNSTFVNIVLNLKDRTTIFSELVNLINFPSANLCLTFEKTSNQTIFILEEKVKL